MQNVACLYFSSVMNYFLENIWFFIYFYCFDMDKVN